jgi:protein SCO1/2/putative membrane protein
MMSWVKSDRLLWLVLIIVLLGVGIWAVVVEMSGGPEPLGRVAEFSFVDQHESPRSLADFRGKVWIAGVTYSCCTMSCPHQRAVLQQLQGQLKRTKILLVTFSAAPGFDSPEALRKLADSLGADSRRWLFLTTRDPQGHELVRQFVQQSFHSDIVENPEAEPGQRFSHPSRLYLIDRNGLVRGSYACVEELYDDKGAASGLFQINSDEVQRLRADAERLYAGPLGRWLKLSWFPAINAGLNALSGLLLLMGYVLIRWDKRQAHAICMLSAVGVSALFLTSYLYYHYFHGATPFSGTGWSRPVYYALLLSHTILAAVVVPLVIMTLYRAWKAQYDRHRRIARLTLPIWLYVSVTGVLVYLFLYQWFPGD